MQTPFLLPHNSSLKKAQQSVVQAQAERAHLVTITSDAQVIPMDTLNADAAYKLVSQRIASLEQKFPNTLHFAPRLTSHQTALPAASSVASPVFQAPDFWSL
jgi:hypothetical protein